jgi:type I restriction enzyme S subunit
MTYSSCKLGDVADVISGYAFKSTDFKDKGIGVIKIKNITPPFISENEMQFVDENMIIGLQKYIVEYNDILISMTGSNVNQFASAVGKVARQRNENGKYLLNQRAGKILIKDKNFYNHDLLFNVLSSFEVRWKLASSAGGSANQANISPNHILDLDIPCPPIEIQNKIAYITNLIDVKIEINSKLNDNLKELMFSLYQEKFGFYYDKDFEGIPVAWNVVPIDTLIEVKDGTHDSPKQCDFGYPLITSKHLKLFEVDFVSTYNISEMDYKKVNERSRVDVGDILLSMIGTVGNVCIVLYDPVEFAIKNVGLFKTSQKIEYSEYIFSLLNSSFIKKYIDSRLAGSTQKYISLTELRKIPVLIPDKYSLKEFRKTAAPLLEMIWLNTKQNLKLIETRDILLPKLMGGAFNLDEYDIDISADEYL